MSRRNGLGILLLLVAYGCSSPHHNAGLNDRGPGCGPPDVRVTSTATTTATADQPPTYVVPVGQALDLVGSSSSGFEVTASVLAVVPPGTEAAVGEGADPLSGVSTALVSVRGTGGGPLRLKFTPREPGTFPVLMRVDYRPTIDCSPNTAVDPNTGQGEAEVALVVARAER